ncbi:MAG: TrkA C-terminal domain-containing protein [Desulfobacteraceae bacterium]|jgi:CPA2 family monovalent cation:H+ antiporter-2
MSENHPDQKLLETFHHFRTMLEMAWVRIDETSTLVNQTLEKAAIRTRTGATVVGVLRGGQMKSNPSADFSFASDDLVAVVGNGKERELFNELANG